MDAIPFHSFDFEWDDWFVLCHSLFWVNVQGCFLYLVRCKRIPSIHPRNFYSQLLSQIGICCGKSVLTIMKRMQLLSIGIDVVLLIKSHEIPFLNSVFSLRLFHSDKVCPWTDTQFVSLEWNTTGKAGLNYKDSNGRFLPQNVEQDNEFMTHS